jgi:tetratricopeptide (TPR) repeat protein
MCKIFILILILFSVSLWAHGDMDDAIIAKDKAIADNPQSAKLYFERAVLYEIHLEYDKALLDINQAEKLQSDLADYNFQRGRVLLSAEKPAKALIALNKSMKNKTTKDFAEAYVLRGRAHAKLKDFQAACADFDQAVKLSEALRPSVAVEQVKAHLNNPASSKVLALRHLDLALKRIGPSLTLYNEKLQILEQQKMYSEAAEVSGEILKIVTRRESWLITRARFYIKAEKKDKAIQDLKDCLADIEKLPEIVKNRKINQKIYNKAKELLESIE